MASALAKKILRLSLTRKRMRLWYRAVQINHLHYMENKNQITSAVANILLWAITLFLAYTFFLSAYRIFSGETALIEMFNRYGGQSLRYTIATLELVGAVLILLPGAVILGSSLLTIALIGILAGNMSQLGGVPGEPVLLLVLTLVLLVGRLSYPASLPLRTADYT